MKRGCLASSILLCVAALGTPMRQACGDVVDFATWQRMGFEPSGGQFAGGGAETVGWVPTQLVASFYPYSIYPGSELRFNAEVTAYWIPVETASAELLDAASNSLRVSSDISLTRIVVDESGYFQVFEPFSLRIGAQAAAEVDENDDWVGFVLSSFYVDGEAVLDSIDVIANYRHYSFPELDSASVLFMIKGHFPEGTYEWRAVPEPATLALVGLGGIALIRRRRDRSK